MIKIAEKMFKIIPEGTHSWDKFITPDEMIQILTENNFSLLNISGVLYNPISERMSFSENKTLNYILVARNNNEIL